jgi:hypothetical protein
MEGCVQMAVTLTLTLTLATLTAPVHASDLRVTTQAAPGLGQMWEFGIAGMPQVANPYDPDLAQLKAVVRTPSGRSNTLAGFFMEDFERRLVGGTESLTRKSNGVWRVRYTPREPGLHVLEVAASLPTQETQRSEPLSFEVRPPAPGASRTAGQTGFARVAPDRRRFEASDGSPLPLIGWNVCSHGARGTFDYDDWFAGMASVGANFARLWMAPWAFGIETAPENRGRYRQDRAWQLDYVFRLAEANGIQLMLCLDYHGMFEVTSDYWGGNNYWPQHPYNAAQGGPCAQPNAFFTHPEAKQLYQQRLRYLVARYGASPSLFAWEFFNEIDNVYQYLKPADVAAWHAEMADWLRRHDPCAHLITTSLTGGSDRADLWQLPGLDLTQYHSYGLARPAMELASAAASLFERYGKPVLVGEYGTDWRGWARTNDPFLRGFRQGLWGGALGGTAGTSMSWWWEQIHAEKLYPVFDAFGRCTAPLGWLQRPAHSMQWATSGPPPASLGAPLEHAAPFSARLMLDPQWGAKVSGTLALGDRYAEARAPAVLNTFVHGTSHSDLRRPLVVEAWVSTNAQLVLHVNSVSSGAIVSVRAGGVELWRKSLPNLDGGWQVNNEYNQDLTVALPAGRQKIEIRNLGQDWFYLDWIQIDGVLPSAYDPPWTPSPEAVGLWQETGGMAYVVNPLASFPANAKMEKIDPLRHAELIITHAPPGAYQVTWLDPETAQELGTAQASTVGQELRIRLPDLPVDLGLRIEPVLRLRGDWLPDTRSFRLTLVGLSDLPFTVERSLDLRQWTVWTSGVTSSSNLPSLDAAARTTPEAFFRARIE